MFDFTIITSIIALIFSSLSFFSKIKNIQCKDVHVWRAYDNIYSLEMFLENHSTLPIAISKINIEIDKKRYNIINQKLFLYGGSIEIMGEEIEEKIFTNKLPIKLDSLSSEIFRFAFEEENEINSKKIYLELYTTRGIIKKRRIKITNEIF